MLRVWAVMWLVPVFLKLQLNLLLAALTAGHWLCTLKFQKAGEADFPLLNFLLLFKLYGASLTFFLKSVRDQGSGFS